MRRALSSGALWTVVAVAAIGGGAAAVVFTGAGTTSTQVLSPDQVREALEKTESTSADKPDEPDPSHESERQTKTTAAGTVTVTCRGDTIASDTVTPAAGWDVGDPAGSQRKREVTFTTDQPTASTGDSGGEAVTMIVTYVCAAGVVTWDSRFE